MNSDLTQREKLILQSVIHNYILTANPVGSRMLARKYNLDFSPATVRNTMADLEEMGLLSHPHTSAGRIPTDLGYREYVNDLTQVEVLKETEKQSLKAHLEAIPFEGKEIFDDISELLAKVSQMLAVILAPDMSTGILDKIELVKVAAGRIMVVVVIASGLVRTILLELNSEILDEDLISAGRVINQRLSGMKLIDIKNNIGERLTGTVENRNAIVRLFIDFPEKIFSSAFTNDMHVGPAIHVLEQPEFSTPEKVRGIVELIEDRDIIVHLLKDRQNGVSVTIGEENAVEELKDMSVITSTYRTGNTQGTVGIIGPTRMNYSRLMALVDYTSQIVSKRVRGSDG